MRSVESTGADFDVLCLSHLRWGFVFQRPQHLLSRWARERRVFYIEEPWYGAERPEIITRVCEKTGVHVLTPGLPHGTSPDQTEQEMRLLLDSALDQHSVDRYLLWVYTPMALGFADHLEPEATVYDCMDELSLFNGAPPQLLPREEELLRRANTVFTGGVALWEGKKDRHQRVYAFPSSVDVPHFAQARQALPDPADQRDIPHPRLGFAGVVDERMDIALVEGAAKLRPDWQFVMLGPVVKIDPNSLPKLPNIHWLGMKDYKDLPNYFANWDVALLPFAKNDATKFISPTKTPEYLAAGLPAISTSIRDVVRTYGEHGLCFIADTPEELIAAAEQALQLGHENEEWRTKVDPVINQMSWDRTWQGMVDRLQEHCPELYSPALVGKAS